MYTLHIKGKGACGPPTATSLNRAAPRPGRRSTRKGQAPACAYGTASDEPPHFRSPTAVPVPSHLARTGPDGLSL